MHYVIRNELSSERQGLTTRIHPDVKEQFYYTCRKLGLLVRGRFNVALEALMQNFNEAYRDAPATVQTQLLGKPSLGKPEPNLVDRLELKMAKKELSAIIGACKEERGHADFREARLHEILPKALKAYRTTRDKALGELLREAEKLV